MYKIYQNHNCIPKYTQVVISQYVSQNTGMLPSMSPQGACCNWYGWAKLHRAMKLAAETQPGNVSDQIKLWLHAFTEEQLVTDHQINW